MTRHKDRKTRIRAQMVLTGQVYAAAARSLGTHSTSALDDRAAMPQASRPGGMQMAEARAVIGDAASAYIAAAFALDREQSGSFVLPPPEFAAGEFAPGHDASRVPDVPRAQLNLDRDCDSPGGFLTWKVESGAPPYVFAQVPPHWLRDVVRPGYAVIDGHLVLQILDRDSDGRPSAILTMVFDGTYDSSTHGWRAYGLATTRTVAWAADGTPSVSG